MSEFSTITEMFEMVTRKFSHDSRPSLLYKKEGSYKGISYPDLRDSVKRFAAGLAALGARRADRIAMISENRPEWVVADMGMMKLGAINVSLFPSQTPKQLEYGLNDSGARFTIVSNQLQLAKILKVWPIPQLEKVIVMSPRGETDPRLVSFESLMKMGEDFSSQSPRYVDEETALSKPEEILTIIYTSGTTGSPRGVVLTHANLVSNILASAACIPFTTSDVLLSYLPICHSYERMAGYYTAFSQGATIAYADSIDTVRDNFLEVQPTVVTTVPRLLEKMHSRIVAQVKASPKSRQGLFAWATGVGKRYADARRMKRFRPDLALQNFVADKLVFSKIRERTGGRLRFMVSGGAALSPDLCRFFEAVGIQIIEGYGMTESSPVISVNRLGEQKPGTVGKPIPNVQVRIAPDGEILVKGPNVMKGYWKNPDETCKTIDSEGWLHTGDIGDLDADGFLKITDRKKHLFVTSGGKNIAPQHIEDLFLQSSFIDQFVLIGDGRMFLAALIVPDFAQVKDFVRTPDASSDNETHLVDDPGLRELFEDEIARIQKDLAGYERVRKFTLLSRPLTLENNELTPTMKVRRKVVEEKFREIIEKMYSGN